MKKLILFLVLPLIVSCQKQLDLKPRSGIILPKTVKDLEALLGNTSIHNISPALAQLSADEYFIPKVADWEAVSSTTAKNAAIWATDIYGGQQNVYAWDMPYSAIFYCNNVLDFLQTKDISNDPEMKRIKGWALFNRSFNFYDLLSTYAKAFDPATASSDPGIPLKLNANIDEIVPRSSVEMCYQQITSDLNDAVELLQGQIISGRRNRPSKVAALALLARMSLSMRNYTEAEKYADQALALYPNLSDFNQLNATSSNGAFNYNSEEIIYFTRITIEGPELTQSQLSNTYGVNPELLSLYDQNDLRLPVYFQRNTLGNYNTKPINIALARASSGLATDELYLIKAECLARKGQTGEAITTLNQLLVKRMKTGTFVPLTAPNATEALDKVLLERRKALVWRSLRWTDLKRLNLEGRNITISRKIGDQTYKLEPNNAKYVLPIPDYEVALSGIEQNIR